MEKLTHWKKLTNPLYMGSYSLLPGEEKVVKIISVAKEKVIGTDGKETECVVAKLKDEKPIILNKTNMKTLTKVFGTPFIEQWVNQKVTVFTDKVQAFGDKVEALRIRPTKPLLPELTPDSAKWEGAVNALKAKTHTIETIEKQYRLSPENKALLNEHSGK